MWYKTYYIWKLFMHPYLALSYYERLGHIMLEEYFKLQPLRLCSIHPYMLFAQERDCYRIHNHIQDLIDDLNLIWPWNIGSSLFGEELSSRSHRAWPSLILIKLGSCHSQQSRLILMCRKHHLTYHKFQMYSKHIRYHSNIKHYFPSYNTTSV